MNKTIEHLTLTVYEHGAHKAPYQVKKQQIMSTSSPDPAETRTMAITNAEIKARVDATEQARKENLIWFSNCKDILTLNDRLTNFSAWQMAIKNVCDKQNCLSLLEYEARMHNKLDINN